jgi:hypothetical protein
MRVRSPEFLKRVVEWVRQGGPDMQQVQADLRNIKDLMRVGQIVSAFRNRAARYCGTKQKPWLAQKVPIKEWRALPLQDKVDELFKLLREAELDDFEDLDATLGVIASDRHLAAHPDDVHTFGELRAFVQETPTLSHGNRDFVLDIVKILEVISPDLGDPGVLALPQKPPKGAEHKAADP